MGHQGKLSLLLGLQVRRQRRNTGTASRKAREQAQQAVLYDQLNREAANKIRNIVQKPSVYRRLPVTSISVDHDYFLYLLRHPEVIINIWDLMDVTDMTATRIAPYTLDTNDGAGTMGRVDLVYGTNNLQIFYGEGEYQGTMLPKKLRGKVVIMVQTQYHLDEEGKPATTSQLDIFMRLENVTLNLLAKTLSPLIGTTADHNFVETINFIQRLNETTIRNGPGVQAMAHRMKNLTPEVRKQFVQAADLVYDRAQVRKQSGNVSIQPAVRSIRSESVPQNGFNPSVAAVPTGQASFNPYPYQAGAERSRSNQQPNGYPPATQPYQTGCPQRTQPAPVQQIFGNENQQLQTEPARTNTPIYSSRQPSYSNGRFYRR